MKVSIIAVLALGTLALLTQILTASPGAPAGIIIRDADNNWDFALTRSASLVGATQSVARRVVVNDAKSVYLRSMIPIPAELRNLVEQTALRIWLDHVNVKREYGLSYPRDLFNDTAAPAISGIALESMRGYAVTVVWTTDEFADSLVRYGLQPGQYPHTAQDPLYTKQHDVTLTGLPPGTTYYFLVRSTDRSGNAAESAEYRFTTTIPTYLPVILQRRR